MNNHHKPVTNDSLTKFKKWVDEMICKHYADRLSNLEVPAIELNRGSKNIRVVLRGSSWCFIEIETGKIMKAASWKSPEPKRYERGNVNDPESWKKWLDPYGPKGLK